MLLHLKQVSVYRNSTYVLLPYIPDGVTQLQNDNITTVPLEAIPTAVAHP